jgi:paraquat-inducible protein A
MTAGIATTQVIQKLSFRNKAAFFLTLLSFFFLFPGIYLSMLTISSEGSVKAKLPHLEPNLIGIPQVQGTEKHRMDLNIFDTTRSVLKTVKDLWEKNYFFVASMIFLFSVIIPFTKGLLVSLIFFTKQSERRKKIFSFIKAIGKWSMCDVFIVAIFLSYLSTGATKTSNVKNFAMMGYSVNVDVQTGMHAHLQMGFWCFLIYCLLSLAALQLYEPY